MKVYRRVSNLEEFEEREKYVFFELIKHVNYWSDTEEVDFMKTSDSRDGCLSRFSSMKGKLICKDLNQLRIDTIDLSVEEFWNKYENNLSGVWNRGNKVIF